MDSVFITSGLSGLGVHVVAGVGGVIVSDVWARGGQGGLDMAKAVVEGAKQKTNFKYLYELDEPIKSKNNEFIISKIWYKNQKEWG